MSQKSNHLSGCWTFTTKGKEKLGSAVQERTVDLSERFDSEQWLTAAGNSTDEHGEIKTKQ